MNKKNKYTVKMSTTPKLVNVMMDIVSRLQKLQYSDQDIRAYPEFANDSYD